MKNLEELKETLSKCCISASYDILWQWVKEGRITIKQFPEMCQYIASRERIYEESHGLYS